MYKALTHKEIEWAYQKWCEGYTQQQIADALFAKKQFAERLTKDRELDRF